MTAAHTLRLLPLALCALALSAPARAEPPIHFTAEQVRSLGITLAAPLATSSASGAPLSAQVIAAPDAEWVVTAQTGGVVVRLPVADGDAVAAGALLAELRSTEAPQMGAELVQAESAAKLAISERERDRQLEAEGIIAARRLQASEQAAAQAESQLAAVRTRMRLMGLNTSDASSGLVKVRSPAAATVLERLVTPGQRVNESDPLLRLADANRLMLELQVPVSDSAFKPGDALKLADGRRAIVRNAGWAASGSVQTLRVRADLPSPSADLHPGQWLRVQRDTPTAGKAWIVPTTAISRHQADSVVFVQHGQDFRALPVQILASDGARTTISGELTADTMIATSGTIAIKGAWLGHGGSE